MRLSQYSFEKTISIMRGALERLGEVISVSEENLIVQETLL